MIDLNQIFSISPANAIFGAFQSGTNQQANSSSSTTFTDVLASTQASSQQFQDETLVKTNLPHQFETTDQPAGGNSNLLDSTPVNPAPTDPLNGPTAKRADIQVSCTSKERHEARVHKDSAEQQKAKSARQSVDAKPNETLKQRKESPNVGETASADGETRVGDMPNDVSSPTAPAPIVNQPMLTGPETLAAQSAQNASANPTNIKKTKASSSLTDLAFAVKVQASSSSTSQDSLASNPVSGLPNVSEDAPPNQLAAQMMLMPPNGQKNPIGSGVSRDNSLTGLTLISASGAQSSPLTSSDPAAQASPQTVSTVQNLPEDQTSAGQMVKTVQVQITNADNERVDLKLVERAGSLTMSVRSAAGPLTKALQQQLPELTSSLNDQQIRAEWWKPNLEKGDSSQTSSDTSSQPGKGSNSATQDQGSQSKGNSGQQGERGTQQPDWVEELSDLRKSTQNGTQITWHL